MFARILFLSFLFLFFPKSALAVTLFNTDFETASLSAWLSSGGGATATISAEAAKSGNYSIKVTHDKTSSYGFQTTIQNIEPGMFYEASAYGKSQDLNLNIFFVRVAWYSSSDGSGSQLSSPNDSNQSSASSDWVQLSTGSIQAPSSANSAKLRLVLTSKTTGQLASAYFDDALLKESLAPSPTPTSTPTSTNTPTPTPTKTPTAIPVTLTMASDSAEILGESTDSALIFEGAVTQVPERVQLSKETKVLGENNFAKFMISIGVIFIAACGILIFRSYRRGKSEIKNL